MDIVSSLRESNSRLLKLERLLDIERDNLINQCPLNNGAVSANNATLFPYMSTIEKYTGFANDYNKELSAFKDLVQKSVNTAKNNNSQSSLAVNNNNNNNNNEITSNYLPTNILSCPVVNDTSNVDDTAYSNDDIDDASNTSSREIATPNIVASNDSNSINEEEEEKEEIPEADEKTMELPKIQPLQHQTVEAVQKSVPKSVEKSVSKSAKPVINSISNNNGKNRKIIKATVMNQMSYKYEGRGFDIWKKNGRRPIYCRTELYCSRIFGDDEAGKAKLKRFLIKRGGFKSNRIENVEIKEGKLRDGTTYKYGLITVCDSKENIENGMDKMNTNKKETIIWEIAKSNYRNGRQNKKLYIKNFDILSGNDHRKLTDLFLNFGDLETDIFINRDRNGNPYGFVTFRDINNAIRCEKNQNQKQYWRYNEPLWFNGRELYIEYVNDNKFKNNNNNKKNGRARKYYNTKR